MRKQQERGSIDFAAVPDVIRKIHLGTQNNDKNDGDGHVATDFDRLTLTGSVTAF